MPLQIINKNTMKINADAVVMPVNLNGDRIPIVVPSDNVTKQYTIQIPQPIWDDGLHSIEEKLRSFYRAALDLAVQYHIESISFPLISADINLSPKEEALSIAISEISAFLLLHEMLVNIVIEDFSEYKISTQVFETLVKYIDQNYVAETEDFFSLFSSLALGEAPSPLDAMGSILKRALMDVVSQLDESFSEFLMRLIREKGKDDVEVYKKANIDRKHFNKIKNNTAYKPTKSTALALAIGLELSLDETKDLLGRAGFTFSHASIFDLVVEYFINAKIYDIYQINEALFAFDQPQLGG